MNEKQQVALVGELYRTVLDDRGIDLTDVQSDTFLQVCTSIIKDYPEARLEELQMIAGDRLDDIMFGAT